MRYTVTTKAADKGVEFITRNAKGEVVSTVQHTYAEAVPLLRKLNAAARR